MNEMEPQIGPGEFPEIVTSETGEGAMPSEMPPVSVEGGVSTEEELAPTMEGMGDDAAPSLPVTEGAGAVAAWQNNKKIVALWSINQNRNSWVSVSGIGWKKLANNSNSAITALTMLSAHAREKGSVVNYREESGMIREMYVW